jgi:hypothetical protein
LILIAVLNGCIRDDREMCPSPDNLTLLFHVEADLSGGVEMYSSVDVLLYDGEGVFVERKRVTQAELVVFPGVHFTVVPGEYRVLAWANASSSRFSLLTPGESLMEQGYIEMTGEGDALYYAPAKTNTYKGNVALRAEETTADDLYAPYRVTVPKGGGEVTKELSFTRAYRSITIYLKGLENLLGGVEALALGQIQAEAHNLSTRYDFLYNTLLSERRDYVRPFAVTMTPDGALPSARFYSAYGLIGEDITLTITHLPERASSVMIFLRDYLMRNPPSSFDDINVLVEFYIGSSGRVEVSITLPGWSGYPVTPIV